MITKTFHLKHNDDDACSQGSEVPRKHEVAQLPSINTTKHTFNLEVTRCARLCSSRSYPSESDKDTHSPTFASRCRSFLPFGLVVVSVYSPLRLHQEADDKARSTEWSAGQARSGETCVGARRRHALVSSLLFDSTHLWIGRGGKCGISDVIRRLAHSLRLPFVSCRAPTRPCESPCAIKGPVDRKIMVVGVFFSPQQKIWN